MKSTSSAVSPTYDDDGNLTEDSKFTYTWNGDVARKCEDGQFRINCAKHEVYRVPSGRDTNQNRLIQVTPKAFEEGVVELYFVYDYQGRRVSKERRAYNPASMKFEFEKRIEYIFDGWNVIIEKATEGSPATAGNTILTKRYWGLDLSGSNLGAGGVGGLLATIATKSNPATVGTETHYFHYDANSNVTETIDVNGILTASYEYGPFGELVSELGTYAQDSEYKFSTKPEDVESGYYYYGYRYYDSSNGRWLNRDPLEEFGGINVYGMVANDPVSQWDYIGMCCADKCALGDIQNITVLSVNSFPLGGSSSIFNNGTSLLNSINTVGAIQGAGGLLSGAAQGIAKSGGAVGGMASSKATSTLDDNTNPASGSMTNTNKMLRGAANAMNSGLFHKGTTIEVELEYEECESKSCFVFWTQLDWEAGKTITHTCNYVYPAKPNATKCVKEAKRQL